MFSLFKRKRATASEMAIVVYNESIVPDLFSSVWESFVPEEFVEDVNAATKLYMVALLLMCFEDLIAKHQRYYFLKTNFERLVFGPIPDLELVESVRAAMKDLYELFNGDRGKEFTWAINWFKNAADYEVSNPVDLVLAASHWMDTYVSTRKFLADLDFTND